MSYYQKLSKIFGRRLAGEESPTGNINPNSSEAASLLEQTVTVSLILVCVYLVYKLLKKDPPPPNPIPKPTVQQKREIKEYTLEELRQYDGSDPEKPILIGISGKVYDVTRGAMFYGRGAAYNVFAGRDATLGFAKNSTDPKDLEGPIDNLNWSEKQSLDEWYGRLSTKYEYAGTFKSSNESTTTIKKDE